MSEREVTVDTGGADDVFPGALVTWLHVPRGGYGYAVRVPAKVLSVTRARVTIQVETRVGARVIRHVAPHSLVWGKGGSGE